MNQIAQIVRYRANSGQSATVGIGISSSPQLTDLAATIESQDARWECTLHEDYCGETMLVIEGRTEEVSSVTLVVALAPGEKLEMNMLIDDTYTSCGSTLSPDEVLTQLAHL